MNGTNLTRSLWRVAITMLIVAAAIAITAAATVSAAPASISGTVTLPGGGLPVPDATRVHLLKPDYTLHGDAQVNAATGAYSFGAAPPGVYLLRAVPPQGSDYTPSNIQPIVVLHDPITADLDLTWPSVVGTAFAPDGATPVDAWVNVLAGNVLVESRLAVSGSIKLGGLYPGTYTVFARRATSDPYWHSAPAAVTISSGVTTAQNLTLTAATVYGTVRDSTNNPVPQAIVYVVRHPSRFERNATDGNGYYAIGGLEDGSYWLAVTPPWDEPGLISPPPVSFSVPPAQQQIDLQFLSPRKIVTGVVKTNADVPVENALVLARRIDKNGEARDLTGTSGEYRLELSEGLWAISVHHTDTSNPARWIYPHPPKLVHFKHDKTNEHKTVNFTVLTADSTVIGDVALPGGATPPFSVTVGLHHGDGVGVSTNIDASGAFTLHVPHGRYKVSVHPDDPNWAGPLIEPIHAPPSGTLDLGTITLIPRDSTITGTLTISGTSTPVEGVPVLAWLARGPSGASGEGGPDGMYAMSVYTGTWLVRPAPKPDQPYLYVGRPEEVEVAGSGNVIADVNFGLIEADATIHGTLVDDSGNLIGDATGWAGAAQIGNPELHNGAPARDGAFDILVPGGASYKVALHLSPGAPYLVSGGAQIVGVGPGATAYVTFTLEAIDSHVVGALWDPRALIVPTGVNGGVFAWMSDVWTRTAIDPSNGAYKLGVTGGVWWLDYHIDPDSGYVELAGPRAIPVPTGANVPVVLPVTTKDALITGSMLAPDGSPMTNTVVLADGFGRELDRLHLSAPVREDGSFALRVPHGTWVLRATTRHDPRLINPASRHIFVPKNGTVSGVTLRFAEADALITGSLSLQGGAPLTGTATLWAWNTHGQYNKVQAGLVNGSGVYTMPVISNTLWHLGAAFETRNTYYITHTRVPVGAGNATQDLVLSGPKPKPGPLAIAFDASEAQYLELADGTRITIPAGALPVTGQVILHITPIATFPHQRHANVYKYGYAFEAFDESGNPIEAHFNQDVLIVFSYSQTELIAQGIHENWLRPAYFSTTTDSWTIPDSYVVDEIDNVVAMQIDHFTDFALTSSEQYQVFLPIVMR
jgi:hypothetical protein